jgi:hypothetical protein
LISAALYVSRKERWRRSVVWRHVQYFASLTKLEITSPIISIVVGSEVAALRAGRCPFSLFLKFALSIASLLRVPNISLLILQAFAKIWISCYTNPTTHSATQLMQVPAHLPTYHYSIIQSFMNLYTEFLLELVVHKKNSLFQFFNTVSEDKLILDLLAG